MSRPEEGILQIQVSGNWVLASGLPTTTEIEQAVSSETLARLCFEAGGLESWDSSLVNVVYKLARHARRASVSLDLSGLPDGLRSLLDLAEVVPPHQEARDHSPDATFLADVGAEAISFSPSTGGLSTSLQDWCR